MNMLAQLKQTEQSMTMSSREIAEVCEARHNDVVVTIERLFEKGLLRESRKTLREYMSPNGGRPTMVYDLTKNDSLKIVSGYSDEVRSNLIDRWAYLEQNNVVNLEDPSQLRSLLLNYAEQNIQLKSANEVLEKTIDNITATENGVKFQQACKILSIKQADLAKWLRDHNWDRYINKSRASTHYSQKLGYCETKFEEVDGVKPSGQPYNYTKIEFFILPKGMAVLAKHFGGA